MLFRRSVLYTALAVALLSPDECSSFQITPQALSRTNSRIQNTKVWSSSPSDSSSSSPRGRKKNISDRTREETAELIRDLFQATVDAGPQAGVARSLQAYRALSTTIEDFLPLPTPPATPFGTFPNPFVRNKRRTSTEPEKFSAPVALRKFFERMGATYIKLGQFVASSPTLFPKEYVVEFQKCLDATEPLEWNVIKRVIESDLGGPIDKYFSYVDETPLASASIAQVHRATLKETGEKVVLKVQKPGIDKSLKADLSFIYSASRFLEFIQPDWERTSLSGIASDIRSSMLEELDFQKEATNVEEFRTFLKENNLDQVATAPYVYRDLTTKKVLTMEFLEGVSLLDAGSVSKVTNENPEQTIITALNVWTQSVTSMPFFHADVHAGNLLVLKDGRVGFIDFGIVGRINEKVFKAVNDLSSALALADYRGMAEALCNMGATEEDVDIDKFATDIERVLNNLGQVQPTDLNVAVATSETGDVQVGATLGFDENEITQVLLDIVDVTESNGLKLPREFGLLVKQSLYFDRYLKILAPELDVVSDARVSGLGERSNTETAFQLNGSEGTGIIDV